MCVKYSVSCHGKKTQQHMRIVEAETSCVFSVNYPCESSWEDQLCYFVWGGNGCWRTFKIRLWSYIIHVFSMLSLYVCRITRVSKPLARPVLATSASCLLSHFLLSFFTIHMDSKRFLWETLCRLVLIHHSACRSSWLKLLLGSTGNNFSPSSFAIFIPSP